ncbi:hypothetical protein CHARACLAT_010242 [Characodon lateralis]|uniref:Uncharacterized protein n=1 Tax=Characodon lateralis TaxID=208331 RepID=A0ABU7EHW8_9TELE|nr:hypothetical protein [Characodon lateralis]
MNHAQETLGCPSHVLKASSSSATHLCTAEPAARRQNKQTLNLQEDRKAGHTAGAPGQGPAFGVNQYEFFSDSWRTCWPACCSTKSRQLHKMNAVNQNNCSSSADP